MNNYRKKITIQVEAACLLSVSSIFTWLAALFKKQAGIIALVPVGAELCCNKVYRGGKDVCRATKTPMLIDRWHEWC